jgi:hypothetical protein
MIQSKFIMDIMEMLLDKDDEGIALRKQLEFLTDSKYEYTGAGVYVNFESLAGIEGFLYGDNSLSLAGVEIKSKEIGVAANARLRVKNGKINYLEIWSYDGVYPYKELSNYSLRRISPDEENNIEIIMY